MADSVKFNFHRPGMGSVGQYQMSAVPYVSANIPVPALITLSSVTSCSFDSVSRFVTIVNEATGANKPLRVGFSFHGVAGLDSGSQNNYFVLDNGESYTGEWRVRQIYMTGAPARNIGNVVETDRSDTTASVIAGLTGIESGNLPNNWTGSTGVG